MKKLRALLAGSCLLICGGVFLATAIHHVTVVPAPSPAQIGNTVILLTVAVMGLITAVVLLGDMRDK